MLINNWTIALLIAITTVLGAASGFSDCSKLIAHEQVEALGTGL